MTIQSLNFSGTHDLEKHSRIKDSLRFLGYSSVSLAGTKSTLQTYKTYLESAEKELAHRRCEGQTDALIQQQKDQVATWNNRISALENIVSYMETYSCHC